MRFVVRRLIGSMVVMWGSITLMFLVFFVLPGNRVDQIIGGDRTVSAQVRAQTAHHLGLDQPAVVQYGRYWVRLWHHDLGTSFVTGRTVTSILHQTVPTSMRLAFWAIVLEIGVGGCTGIWAATRKRRGVVTGTLAWAWTGWTGALMAIPVFALGYVLQLVFGVFPFLHSWPNWARLPVQGLGPNSWVLGVFPVDGQWRYVVLPAITLAAVSTAVTSRLMHSSLKASFRRDYIRGALAKGLSDRQVLWRHGVRNALIPVVTFVGLDMANLFGSAVVTENVFNWPGVGSQVSSALVREDAPVILGLTLVLGVAYIAINFAVDIAYGSLDPRVRDGRA